VLLAEEVAGFVTASFLGSAADSSASKFRNCGAGVGAVIFVGCFFFPMIVEILSEVMD
jgi:hypothetical protein